MTQTFFWCYPWDLEDEGYETAIGRLAGEIGVDAISLGLVLPDIVQFRPRSTGGPRTVRRPAAAHFKPSAESYVNTPLCPPAASWMKSRNPIEQIAGTAERNGLKLRAWIVACDNVTLVKRHPSAGCVDVFGDAITGRLCPSNPDVRQYIAGLVEDLVSNYSVDAVELQSVDFGEEAIPSEPHETNFDFGTIGRVLKNWCLCAACRQRAEELDIDSRAVESAVRAILERVLRLEPLQYETFEELMGEVSVLGDYARMRCEAVSSLIRTVRKRAGGRLLLHVPHDESVGGTEVQSLSEYCARFVIPPSRGPRDPSPGAVSERFQRASLGADRLEIGVNGHPPHINQGPDLVKWVREAWQAGYGGIGFANYGVMPEPCLDWVRQAIRFARRDSVGSRTG